MSVTITLHVFSGVPDPAWELSEEQTQELAERLAGLERTTLFKPPGIAGGLGYGGFSIEAVREKGLDPLIYVNGGIADFDRFDLNRLTDGPHLEEWLLRTAGNTIEPDLSEYVIAEIQAGTNTLADLSAGPASFLSVPPYKPGKWNNDPKIRRGNNCYNYANDKITNTFAQPGRGSGKQGPHPPTCRGTGAAAERDGQVSVSSVSGTPAQGHFIGLAIWPRKDYHWYRLDSNAYWSHKPGKSNARNTDNSGKTILDPETCNRGPYKVWCGYYHCIPANTRIQ